MVYNKKASCKLNDKFYLCFHFTAAQRNNPMENEGLFEGDIKGIDPSSVSIQL